MTNQKKEIPITFVDDEESDTEEPAVGSQEPTDSRAEREMPVAAPVAEEGGADEGAAGSAAGWKDEEGETETHSAEAALESGQTKADAGIAQSGPVAESQAPAPNGESDKQDAAASQPEASSQARKEPVKAEEVVSDGVATETKHKGQNGHGGDSHGSANADDGIGLVLADADALQEAQSRIDTLLAERSGLYDQILRVQAEFENFRRRTERDKADQYQRVRGEVLLELLPVMDNFERALAAGPSDAESLRTGLELIHRQLKDALTKMGLQPVPSLGIPFDPNIHEAITLEPTDEHEENTVIQEFERGYTLGERLLRPAKVKVAAQPDR
ncbi:MAG TPA: nucleotide exchange factor GrpE [Blastocatellia bacterium]|nr:nucleotide exchange factor GrpE [Blastocatellia bacterium]